MPDGIAFISAVERYLSGQLALHAEAPRVYGGNLAGLIRGLNVHGKPCPARDQRRRQVVNIPRENIRSIGQGRIAEPIEVGNVLSKALEKRAGPAAYRSLSIAEGIPGKAEPGRDLVLAVIGEARRNAGAFLHDPVETIA